MAAAALCSLLCIYTCEWASLLASDWRLMCVVCSRVRQFFYFFFYHFTVFHLFFFFFVQFFACLQRHRLVLFFFCYSSSSSSSFSALTVWPSTCMAFGIHNCTRCRSGRAHVCGAQIIRYFRLIIGENRVCSVCSINTDEHGVSHKSCEYLREYECIRVYRIRASYSICTLIELMEQLHNGNRKVKKKMATRKSIKYLNYLISI